MISHLQDLKKWLINCNYPEKLINKAIHNAQLQGPAPKPKYKKNTLPFATTFYCNYSNYSNKNVVKFINDRFTNDTNINIKEYIFSETNTVLSQKQPPNLLQLLSKAKLDTARTALENGLFTCNDKKRGKLCQLYIRQCKSFLTSNGKEWLITSYITCHSKNVYGI